MDRDEECHVSRLSCDPRGRPCRAPSRRALLPAAPLRVIRHRSVMHPIYASSQLVAGLVRRQPGWPGAASPKQYAGVRPSATNAAP
jgi:hypothetical protein